MQESGLLGVSGISHDMRELLASASLQAQEAVDLYCHMAARQVAALAAVLGGLDLLVFTAGIGEHQPPVRGRIAAKLEWMGVRVDAERNDANVPAIHAEGSAVEVRVIPTDEALAVARACAPFMT
jgi:acetate kinase